MQNKTHKNRVVCITGGSRGIGRDLAIAFSKNGYQVFVGARNESMIESAAPNIHYTYMDVRSENCHLKLIETALSNAGHVDCYINNAGRSDWKSIGNIDESFLEEMLAVNLKSVFWGCKQASKYLNSRGSIINISSLAARRGTPNNSAYCAAKFGVTGLTQSMAKELGSKGIRVNAICPVLIDTPGLMSALEGLESPAKGEPVEFLKTFTLGQSALDRLPTGNDVADMALFLASEAARSITGQSIHVDCGVLPQ